MFAVFITAETYFGTLVIGFLVSRVYTHKLLAMPASQLNHTSLE